MDDVRWGAATVAARGGYEPGLGEGLVPGIQPSSTFVVPGNPGEVPYSYARGGSPAYEPLERALAALEGGADAVVFSAGMAAAIALLEEAPAGTAVVMPGDAYYGIRVYAEQELPKRGVEARVVDPRDRAALERALDGASLLWAETPTNPHVAITDLANLAALAAAHGVPWVCDNTFATPILQRPIEHGALATMHSLTKYVGGHGDLILGAAACADQGLAGRLRARRNRVGTQPDAFSCWLARRGVQTLPLRIRRQSATALDLAGRLAAHPRIARVHYPGLPDDPGHAVAARQMDGAFGAIVSVVVEGGAEAAQAVVDNVRLWIAATSLGGVESSLERRARWAGEVADPALLRLSVGVEEPEDLWRDLEQALA